MAIRIVKEPIPKAELVKLAREEYGGLVKAVVDTEKEVMAVGGELHADEQALLMEKEGARGDTTWGVNLYPNVPEEDWVEFDSMVNIKPGLGNRSRGVERQETRERIRGVINKLVI